MVVNPVNQYQKL